MEGTGLLRRQMLPELMHVAGCLILALTVLLGFTAVPAVALTGDLTRKPGALGEQLWGAGGFVISPDGRNAYGLAGGTVFVFDRDPATGDPVQKPGIAGCFTEDGGPGQDPQPGGDPPPSSCSIGREVAAGGLGLEVSPDGDSVYAGGAVFDRDRATGGLTQKPGRAGCVTEDGSPVGDPPVETCTDVTLLGNGMTVSSDGRNLYGVSSFSGGAVVVLDRDPTTGVLSQKATSARCVAEIGVTTCADGFALLGATQVALSPDGGSAYVASNFNSGAVVVLDRNPATGSLSQKAGSAGCVAEVGGVTCTDGKALQGAQSLMVSPDSRNVYVSAGDGIRNGRTSGDAVTSFDRDPTTGTLTQKAGKDGCISETGTPTGNPPVNACIDGVALDGQNTSLRLSPDGLSTYVAVGNSYAITWFDRDPITGVLSLGGCITAGGTGGLCTTSGTNFGGQPSGLTISPDGRDVYTNTFFNQKGYLWAFDRERDLLPPQTTITGGPRDRSTTGNSTPAFRFVSSEGGSTFACSVDADPFRRCSSPFTTAALGLGGHTFSVRATDTAGNVDPTPASRTFTIIGIAASAGFAGCPSLAANVIRGTAAADTIRGTAGADRIFAGTGSDVVAALGAGDCVDLGAGNDRGNGGTGNDLLLGGTGDDQVSGGAGEDRVSGSAGKDRIDGGSSGDTLSGGSDRDRIKGGSGSDRISGGAGNDSISARDRRRDRVNCGSGSDRVVADRGDRVARNCERVRYR